MDIIDISTPDQLLLEVSRQMHDHGWAMLGTEYERVPFFLTVGLEYSYQHPNLEVFGLDEDRAREYLDHLIGRIQQGEKFVAGDFFSGLTPGYDLILVENPCDPNGPPLTGGRLRMCWPDKNHRYPWDHDCDKYCAVQTYLPPIEGINLEGIHLMLGTLGAKND